MAGAGGDGPAGHVADRDHHGDRGVVAMAGSRLGWHADDRDVWNEVQVTCQNTRITTVINGVTIADYDGAGRLDDETHRIRNVGRKGRIGLQIHPGDVLRIRFKDIEIRQP